MKKVDFQWMFVLFGTAVGAGILFLPLQASESGFIAMIIATIIVLPMIFFCRAKCCNIGCVVSRKGYGCNRSF